MVRQFKLIGIWVIGVALMGAGVSGAPDVMAAPKGTLTIAQGVDADTLDPQVTSSSAAWSIILNIYDTLITRDKEGKLQPGLAVSWRSLNDTTWEIKLRPNVKFHNGEPMDAEAVKFSLLRVLDPNLKSVFATTLDTIARVEIVDPLTVRVVTKAPDPILPSRLSMQFGEILSPKYSNEVGPRGLARKPIGAGPYRFVSWERDEAITLEAVPDHWRKPKIAKVIFKPIPEGSSRVAAIKTGAVDIAVAIPPIDFASVNQGDKTFGINATSNRAYLLNMDTLTFKPFQDRRVRQAINYAIDKQAIIKNTLSGFGKPIATSVIPEAFGHNPNIKPYPYDPEKAKQLLAEAGYPNGFEVGFDTTSGRYPQDKEVAEVVSGQLAKVGIKVNVQTFEWGAFYDGVKAKKRAPIHNIGMSDELFDAEKTFSLHFKAGTIWSRWNNPEFDKLLDAARATMDEKARQQALWRAGQIQHDEAPMIFLYQISYLYGVNKRVKNWQPTSIEPILVWDASVD
jgi:peptide/nickel transport system substrate-binding protein